MEGEPAAKKLKADDGEPSDSNFESFVMNAPSTAYSCFYFLVGDPKKGNPEMIPSSKLHLMAHSVPMRKMLEESEIAEKGTITLVDIEPDTFKNFIKFVNRCDIVPSLSFEEAVNLMYVAEKYIVEDLKGKLGKHVASLVTIDNVFVTMVQPECLQEKTLKNAIDTIVQQKTKDLVSREEFLQLNTVGVLTIVGQKILALTEIDLWRALLRWAKHVAQSEEGSKLREVLAEPIKEVRFCTLDPGDFNKEVSTTDILDDAEIASITKAAGGKTEFVKCPSICYELIKRDFYTNDQVTISFIHSGFTKIDLSNSSYIYLTTKSRNVQLIEAGFETGLIQPNSSVQWSGKVFLTKITDEQTNTSSVRPIDCDFSITVRMSNYPGTISFYDKMKLDAYSKYKLEFISSSCLHRFCSDQDDFMVDRDGLVVHMNKDCPVTHFRNLSYKAL